VVNGKVIFLLGGEPIQVEGAALDKPFFGIDEAVTAQTEMLPNIPEPIKTTYRKILLNAIIFAEPFGNKVTFMAGELNGKILNGIIERNLREELITIDEYRKFMKSMGFITLFTDFCVPTASPKVLAPSKKVAELKDRLIKENIDNLHDPVVVSKIDAEITKALKEELEGDEAEGFFIKDKSINTVRKMTHGMIGGVPRLDDETKVETIPRSLEEGWRAEDLPAIANNLRSGSYDRGKDTALGGEAAKMSGRMYQNTKITEADCGSKVGLPINITKENYKEFVGHYKVSAPSKPLSESDLKGLIGKEVIIRSPIGCRVKSGNYCEKCIGDTVAKSGIGLGPQLSAVGSVFLSISLSAFHGKQLRTEEYDHLSSIS